MSTFSYILSIFSSLILVIGVCGSFVWLFRSDEQEDRTMGLIGFLLSGVILTTIILLIVEIYKLGGLS